ncbi:MAG: hypothetical protein LBM19_03520 [Holosporales bacterium]|nr:hypothetical protein [Holosporales bacterium]
MKFCSRYHNIYLLAPAIIPIYLSVTCQGTLLFVRSHALDKTLYKSVEIFSFQKINIIGGIGLIVWFLIVNDNYMLTRNDK